MLSVLGGCDLVDPMRSTPQADTETFGNLLEAAPDPSREGAWIAKIRVGVPRALGRSDDARPTPDVAGGITAVVVVTADTVVVVDDRPVALMDIGPGTEIVAIPVPGTTTMVGENEIHLEAAQLMDFGSYARWRLPKLQLAGGPAEVIEDVDRINTAGVEGSPVPVGDGTILYFSGRLRPPELPGGAWIGARRDGLTPPAEGERSFDRSFRTELGDDGWSTPELVVIPGTEPHEHVKLTWVSADERRCYVTVSDPDGSPWVGVSERAGSSAAVGRDRSNGGHRRGGRLRCRGHDRLAEQDRLRHDPERKRRSLPLRSGHRVRRSSFRRRSTPAVSNGGPGSVPPTSSISSAAIDSFASKGDGSTRCVFPDPTGRCSSRRLPRLTARYLFFAAPKFRPIDFDLDIQVAAHPRRWDARRAAMPVDEWRP